jgi:hypothetical protein
VATTGNNGTVSLSSQSGNLTLTQNVSANGSGYVDLRASGGNASAIHFNNGASVVSSTGNVQLVSSGDIRTDSLNGTAAEVVTNGTLFLQAGGGIGTNASRIEMRDVGTVAASAAGSAAGDIFVRQVTGTSTQNVLTVGNVAATNLASTLDGTVANLSGVATTANSGNVSLTTQSGSLTLTQNVSAHGAGYVDLRAAGGTGSALNLNNGASVVSSTGNVQLVSTGDIRTDSLNGTAPEVVTGGTLWVQAGGGIGTNASRIEIRDVGTLAASAAGSAAGDIFVR